MFLVRKNHVQSQEGKDSKQTGSYVCPVSIFTVRRMSIIRKNYVLCQDEPRPVSERNMFNGRKNHVQCQKDPCLMAEGTISCQ